LAVHHYLFHLDVLLFVEEVGSIDLLLIEIFHPLNEIRFLSLLPSVVV
jgi:hypothetical protein